MTQAPKTIGVIGAGTMGAGIAQLAAQSGAQTLLHDAIPGALESGLAKIGTALDRLTEKGKMTSEAAAAARARIEPAGALTDLGPAELVIEAAPERMELKREVYAALAEAVSADCVLATNTSSLSVTEIAAGVPRPERVVGLHFFNPAPVMRLVEVVAGEQSDARALGIARAAGEAMGKHVIDARDIAGFLVNRCNRPFSLEALRLLAERVATVEQIDRIARLGGGFRMGPFELMDLIGLETNHAVAESFHRQTYNEPRYQPSPIQARMIASGRLGRKTGSGWYEYPDGADQRPVHREPPAPGGGDGRAILITGELPVAGQLANAARGAGFDVTATAGSGGGPSGEPWLTVLCGGPAAGAGPRARLLADGSLHLIDPEAAGFHVLPPVTSCGLAEVTSTPRTHPVARERTSEFLAALGMLVEPVGDAPGLVLGRIVCALINEAAFLIGEGNGTPEDVDAGMELGVNHPRGPVAWSREIGLGHVVATLDALHREHGEPRYRLAPMLRRRAAIGAELA